MRTRKSPNIMVTGTPGTGKSSLCSLISQAAGFQHINVSELAKTCGLCESYDDIMDSYIIDEDKVCDTLEDMLADGGCLVEYHSCDFFPERWFDLVVVLQTDNPILYERLQKRGYSEAKIRENISCEIMQVVLDEARESYKEEIVQAVSSNTVDDMEQNLENIQQWIINHAQLQTSS